VKYNSRFLVQAIDQTKKIRYYGGEVMVNPWLKSKLAAASWETRIEAETVANAIPRKWGKSTYEFNVVPETSGK